MRKKANIGHLMSSYSFKTRQLIFSVFVYFSYNKLYYKISKFEENLFFGKKIAQVWAVTLKLV